MRGGRDATRRNRNQGTAKRGRGQDNRQVIPQRWEDSVYDWKRSPNHRVVTREIHGCSLPFMVEATREDSMHACTVDDVARVLNLIPPDFLGHDAGEIHFKGIVLRQPTRREGALHPVWGRMCYGTEVGRAFGPVIILESQRIPLVVHRSRSLQPHDERELERLRECADSISEDSRAYRLVLGPDGVRRVQLYHTLLHEIGHWIDMLLKVALPGRDDDALWARLWDRYFERASSEREEFAHRYADAQRVSLRKAGLIPFDRLIDEEVLEADGLDRADFELP